MSYKFMQQPLRSGLYEPEGLYLALPCTGQCTLIHTWGEQAAYYSQFTYNGVPLQGHNGLDFQLAPDAQIVAVDAGRIVEISRELGGFERYVKLEHRWGESLYALLGAILVESGQSVARGAPLAEAARRSPAPLLHFGIRIAPFNRYDGWGGFTDPLPFLAALPENAQLSPMDADSVPHPMIAEEKGVRRP